MCLCHREVESKWRYSGSSPGDGTESSSSQWQCSSLRCPPGSTVQSEHSCGGWASKLHHNRGGLANNSLWIDLLFVDFSGMMLVGLNLCPQSFLCVAKSQFYVQIIQIPEGHLQRQVQPPFDFLHSWRSSGIKGFLYRAEKGGIVPVGSGKRATVGISDILLGNKSQEWWQRIQV